MNQGYEVVEYILGRTGEPGGRAAARREVRALPFNMTVERHAGADAGAHPAVRGRERAAVPRASCSDSDGARAEGGRGDLPQERLHQQLLHDPRRRGRDRGRRGRAPPVALAGPVLRRDEPALRPPPLRHGVRRRGLRADRVAAPRDHEADELGRGGEARGRPALRHPRDPDGLRAGGELRRAAAGGRARALRALQDRRAAVQGRRRGRPRCT